MLDITLANTLLGWGTLLLNIATLPLLYLAVTQNNFLRARELIATWSLAIGFALTAVSAAITLYYSEVLGAIPCGLCWFQRVFLYPQIFIFGIALFRKDHGAWVYATALSAAGAVIALYQHYLQMGGTEALPCPITGSEADCAARTMFELGYVTYPFTALSLFIFIILLLLVSKSRK